MPKAKRFVYGTRIRKWVLVGENDRDFKDGLTPAERKRLGNKKAIQKYLRGRIIK